MTKVLRLLDYNGKPHHFEVEDADEVFGVIFFTVSGDQCAVVIYDEGDIIIFDSDELRHRLIGFGPEDLSFVPADEIKWEQVYEA